MGPLAAIPAVFSSIGGAVGSGLGAVGSALGGGAAAAAPAAAAAAPAVAAPAAAVGETAAAAAPALAASAAPAAASAAAPALAAASDAATAAPAAASAAPITAADLGGEGASALSVPGQAPNAMANALSQTGAIPPPAATGPAPDVGAPSSAGMGTQTPSWQAQVQNALNRPGVRQAIKAAQGARQQQQKQQGQGPLVAPPRFMTPQMPYIQAPTDMSMMNPNSPRMGSQFYGG